MATGGRFDPKNLLRCHERLVRKVSCIRVLVKKLDASPLHSRVNGWIGHCVVFVYFGVRAPEAIRIKNYLDLRKNLYMLFARNHRPPIGCGVDELMDNKHFFMRETSRPYVIGQ